MNSKILSRLRQLHVRLDHDVRAEAARRVPDPVRLGRLKKLRLAIKDRLASFGQPASA